MDDARNTRLVEPAQDPKSVPLAKGLVAEPADRGASGAISQCLRLRVLAHSEPP